MIITICAFTDNEPNSVAYKKFDSIDKAVEFYRKMLEKENVNVISTRKINPDKSIKITPDTLSGLVGAITGDKGK